LVCESLAFTRHLFAVFSGDETGQQEANIQAIR
jgi:hypothetical protein